MNTQPTSPAVDSPTPVRPGVDRLESFVRDIGASLKDAEHGIQDAYEKLRHRKPDASAALPTPPAPAAKADKAQAVLAGSPRIMGALEAIKGELGQLIDAHGGFGALAADGVQIIEGALADPQKEGAVVVADLAQVIARMVSDLVLHVPSAQAAETAPAPAVAEDHA